jgi:hypothetical protein
MTTKRTHRVFYDLTSIGLVKLVAEFNAGLGRVMGGYFLSIAVALNPNVRHSESVGKLVRKIEAGAHFALTQPNSIRTSRCFARIDRQKRRFVPHIRGSDATHVCPQRRIPP